MSTKGEEDSDAVAVRYDDDLQPTLASLAVPADPFARGLSAHSGWRRQVTAVFSEGVHFPGELENDPLPLDSPTNAALIGEGLANLHLSDARGDGVACRTLAGAARELTRAVAEAQRKVAEMRRPLGSTERKALLNERASGFFLPVWALMEGTKNVDADAEDVLRLSRSYLAASGLAGPSLMDEIMETSIRTGDKNIVGLLNLVSSSLGLHLVHEGTARSAMFGRMNRWLHRTLLRNFDRYRVAFDRPPMMKKTSDRSQYGRDVFDLMNVERVLVRIPVSEGGDRLRPLISDAWRRKERLAHPENSAGGSRDIVMDGVRITIKQHNYSQPPEGPAPPRREGPRFRTGRHAAFHFRWTKRRTEGAWTEDDRGNTLSFVYGWPDMVYARSPPDPVVADRVEIILYGSGKVRWWEDYYRPAAAAAAADTSAVMPYPSRRVYVAEGDTVTEHLYVTRPDTTETPVRTWVEYHDIMQLVFAQALYGHFDNLSEAVENVQALFSTFVSGATSKVVVNGVAEAREMLAGTAALPYLRLDTKGDVLTAEKDIAKDRKIIRKFPRMRDVLMSRTIEPVWRVPIDRGGARGRAARTERRTLRDNLATRTVPSADLSVVRKTAEGSVFELIEPQPRIATRVRCATDVFAVEGQMSWLEAGLRGVRNMTGEVGNVVEEELAEGVIISQQGQKTLADIDVWRLKAGVEKATPDPSPTEASPEAGAAGFDGQLAVTQQGVVEQLFGIFSQSPPGTASQGLARAQGQVSIPPEKLELYDEEVRQGERKNLALSRERDEQHG